MAIAGWLREKSAVAGRHIKTSPESQQQIGRKWVDKWVHGTAAGIAIAQKRHYDC